MKRFSFILMSSAFAVLLAVDVTYFCSNSAVLSQVNASSSSGSNSSSSYSSSSSAACSCLTAVSWSRIFKGIGYGIEAGRWLQGLCSHKKVVSQTKETHLKWQKDKLEISNVYDPKTGLTTIVYQNWEDCTEYTGSGASNCDDRGKRNPLPNSRVVY